MLIAEALHEKRSPRLLMKLQPDTKAYAWFLSGPSSSGKPLFVSDCISNFVSMAAPSNDFFRRLFCERENTPRDETGEYDFEALEALDLKLLTNNWLNLFKGWK